LLLTGAGYLIDHLVIKKASFDPMALVLGLIGAVIGAVVGHLIKSSDAPKIKSEGARFHYPPIMQKVAEGWAFGESPPELAQG
jgi:hypothetical protein